VGRVDMLRQCAREVDTYRGDESFAYQIASALLDLALGFASHDRAAAGDRVDAGLTLAAKYGLHELDFQFRALAEELAEGRRGRAHTAPIHVAPRAETVLRDLMDEADALDGDRLTNCRLAATTLQ